MCYWHIFFSKVLNVHTFRTANTTSALQRNWSPFLFRSCVCPTFRQYYEALESYKNMTQQMKNLNSFIKSLDSVMNHRLHAYAELRRRVVNLQLTVLI